MKTNTFKRKISLLIIFTMVLSITSEIYAKESSTVENVKKTGSNIVLERKEDDVFRTNSTDFDNYPVRGIVPSNGVLELKPTLESYIGLNKSFVINATSDSNTGVLFVYLYKPNGNIQSNDWIMGVNEVVKWDVFLPSSGTWTVRFVAQGTTSPVNVYARWE